MPPSVYNSTSVLSNDSHSSDQIQGSSTVTSMSSRSAAEHLNIYEYQITEASMPTLSASSSPAMRGDSLADSLADSYSSSRDLEDLVISRVNTPSYPTNQSMEQEDEEFVPETSEWNELLDALQVERRRVTMFHSMSPIERFLSGERVEDCSVELRVWGAEEHPKQ